MVPQGRIGMIFDFGGSMFSPPVVGQEFLEKELHAARRAGLVDVELQQSSPISTFDTGARLRFPRLAQFTPRKYLAGLTKAIRSMGGKI